MNLDQFNSLVRSLLKVAGAALAAHGLSAAASIVNSQDVIGLALVLAGVVWSHFTHSESGSSGSTTGPSTGQAGSTGGQMGGQSGGTALLLLFLLPALLFGSGCAGVSQNAFTSELAAASTADAAMRGYAAYWNQAAKNPAAFHRTTNELATERATVENASIKIGASIELVESLRGSYATNAAVKPQLQAALVSLGENTGNIIGYVNSLFCVSNSPSLTSTNQ